MKNLSSLRNKQTRVGISIRVCVYSTAVSYSFFLIIHRGIVSFMKILNKILRNSLARFSIPLHTAICTRTTCWDFPCFNPAWACQSDLEYTLFWFIKKYFLNLTTRNFLTTINSFSHVNEWHWQAIKVISKVIDYSSYFKLDRVFNFFLCPRVISDCCLMTIFFTRL